jgi:G3E family GTPase
MQAIDEIIANVKPEHIIVETTGVVDPESLIYDIIENIPKLKLDSVVCVVDSHAVANYGIGQTARKQIDMADILLVNKVDLIDKNKLLEIQEELEKINPTAAKIRTIKCRTETDLLFGMYTEKPIKKHKHETEGIDTLVFMTDRKATKEGFEGFLKEMKGVVRAKGFIIFEDGTYLFNYVNGRYDFEKFAADKTELVFIGEKFDKELLKKKLEKCFE